MTAGTLSPHAHYICDVGELTVTGPTGTLPFKSTSPSGQLLIRLKNDLADQGLFRYSDMFAIAEHHLLHHPDIAQATAHRFPFVLLDEMQDTSDLQQHLLDQVFGKVGTVVQRAGDVNQGIFTDRTQAPLLPSAFPHPSAAQLPVSRRFGTQIADLASRLRPSSADRPSTVLAPRAPSLCCSSTMTAYPASSPPSSA